MVVGLASILSISTQQLLKQFFIGEHKMCSYKTNSACHMVA